MIVKESLESLLGELFPHNQIQIAPFSMDWILSSPEATEDSVRVVYAFLRSKGLKDDKISSQAQLLGKDPETIEATYQRLKKLGLSDRKIATNAHLLGKDPETIEANHQRLKKLGLSDRKIATNAHLLGMNPETIDRNYKALQKLGLSDDKTASQAQLLGKDPETIEATYQRLKKLGLSDRKIATRAELLGMNTKTIESNYQHHVGLLRQDYRNRNSGRDLLITYAQLLGISSETIEANVQFLHNRGVGCNSGFLLGTKPQTKRKKMAWMLRELFDYRSIPQEQRKEAINGLYGFIRDNPGILIKSLNSMEKSKDELRERVAAYKQ